MHTLVIITMLSYYVCIKCVFICSILYIIIMIVVGMLLQQRVFLELLHNLHEFTYIIYLPENRHT